MSKFAPGLIGVPCLDSMPTRCADSLTQLAIKLPPRSEVSFIRGGNRRRIPKKRNAMVRQMLRSDHLEWIFFIDSDTVFRLRDAKLVLGGLDKWDMVSGVVPCRTEPFPPNVSRYPDTAPRSVDPLRPIDFEGFTDIEKGKPDVLNLESWGGYWECNVAGTAFLAINRHVFEAMDDPWFCCNEVIPTIGGDQNFTLRATDAGFTLAADLRAQCEHLVADWGVTFQFAKSYREHRWGLGWGAQVGPPCGPGSR